MATKEYDGSPVSKTAFKTIWRLTKLVQPWWKLLSIALLTALFTSLSAIAAAAVGALLIGHAAEGASLALLRPYLIAFGVLTVFTVLMVWAFQWLAHYIAYGILALLRTIAYDALEPLAPAYTIKRRSGDLISMVMDDIEFLEWYYAHTCIQMLVACIVPVIVLVVLGGAIHWLLPLILLPFVLLIAVLPLYLRPRGDALAQELQTRLGGVNAHMVDSIQGLREVIAFGRRRARLSEVDAESRSLTNLQIEQGEFIGKQGAVIQVAIAFGVLATLIGSVTLVAHGLMPAYQVLLAVILAVGAFTPLLEMSNMTRAFNRVVAAGQRFFAVLDEPVLIEEKPVVQPITGSIEPTIAFENVTFHYHLDEPPVLKDVCFGAQTGETVALVGPSGAGKSTITSLLLRFWDPQQGRISLGGRDLRDFTLAALRDHITIVQQDAYMFNTSVRENIRIGKHDATDTEVEDAAKKAYLHEFITTLPQGYDTLLGEHGAKLSGGQRQRISIARALLKDAPILILDEATSNLDAESERVIRDGIARLMGGRTTLIIAHRLSTIVSADHIIVLDHGRVVEVGTHASLMTREGTYSRMVAAQRDVIA